MAPFPEAEIMTIKRLEVALRKADFKLLKEGAYKLHEKFHEGFQFEHLDLLKEIYVEITDNPSIPQDTVAILAQTINDIIAKQDVVIYKKEEPSNNADIQNPQKGVDDNINKPIIINEEENVQNEDIKDDIEDARDAGDIRVIEDEQNIRDEKNIQNDVSSATEAPLRDNILVNSKKPEKLSAFDAFKPDKIYDKDDKNYSFTPVKNPIYDEMFDDSTPKFIIKDNINSNITLTPDKILNKINTNNINRPVQSYTNNYNHNLNPGSNYAHGRNNNSHNHNHNKIQSNQTKNSEIKFGNNATHHFEAQKQNSNNEIQRQNKEVAIFYGQTNSLEKVSNIIKLRQIVLDSKENQIHFDEFFSLLSELKAQVNSNVAELKNVLEKLKSNKNITNLITSCQSEDFFHLFHACDINYSLYNDNESYEVDLLPIFGISNYYHCMQCDEKYLDLKSGIKPLILECPKCKKPMYPDLYALGKNSKINIEYYNMALNKLAQSKIWLLIQPSYGVQNDMTIQQLLKTAFQLSNSVEKIFILDKDINNRENYKKMFNEINKDVYVNTQISALEDFMGAI